MEDGYISKVIKDITLSNLKYDLSITSTKVLIGELGFFRAIICVKEGKIARIAVDPSEELQGDIQLQSSQFINYGEKIIMSGVIDINVSLHANFEDKEWAEIENLTKIALAGGVTMVVNNPLLDNPKNIVELNKTLCDCNEKIKAMRMNSYVDFAQLSLLTKTNYKDIFDREKMQKLRQSIIGFRTYFSPSYQPEVDYCSNKLQILSFIDQLKDMQDMCVFVHPIYLQCEKELGVTSPMRNHKIQSRIEMESSNDAIHERSIPCADAVQGETHEEERWSSLELEPLRNNQIQQKLLKIFPMAQQKTMQSALKLLSIQEKRQYLCSSSNTQSGENNKSEEDENQNTEAEDRYLEFKRLNDAKHSFLSIESEDDTLNNHLSFTQNEVPSQQQQLQQENGTSLKMMDSMKPVSINLDSSKLINYKTDNGQSYEDLTETGSRTTYRNSLSPQKDQDKQEGSSSNLNDMQNIKLNVAASSITYQQTQKLTQKLSIPSQRNLIEHNNSEDSPDSSRAMRPKSNSNLLIRRKLQLMKNDNTPAQQNGIRKVNFLMHSNSNLYLPGSEQADSNEAPLSNQSISKNDTPDVKNKTFTSVAQNQIEEEEENNEGFSLRQINIGGGGFTRIRSHTSSHVLNTKRKVKDLEMKQKLRRDYLNFLTYRPPFWENIAINFFKQKFMEYQQNKIEFKPALVFTNVSNSYSVAKIFRQKLRNPNFKLHIEVSSPFLYFDSSSIKEGETKFKNEPAIYDKLNKKLLLSELEIDSVIDCVGSNHFYVPPKFKPQDFTRAFNGLNSIGANLYSLWTLSWINLKRKFKQEENVIHQKQKLENGHTTNDNKEGEQINENQTASNQIISQEERNEVSTSDIPINEHDDKQKLTKENDKLQKEQESSQARIEKKILQLSRLLSINPAKILGISDQKGQIKEGLDADFVVWDPFDQSKFVVDNFQDQVEISPLHIFNKKNFYGKIHSTIIRGHILYSISSAEDNQYQNQLSTKTVEIESTERFSPFMKRNTQDFNPHIFADKNSFQAKLIIKN